jgi:hypothetical protein
VKFSFLSGLGSAWQKGQFYIAYSGEKWYKGRFSLFKISNILV